MATIYVRGGYYHTSFTVAGKRYRKSTGISVAEDKQKALAVAQEMEESKRNESIENENNKNRIKLEDAIKRTHKVMWEGNKSEKEPARHCKHILEFMGNIYLDEITADMIFDWQESLKARGCSKATINRYGSTFRTIFNRAVEWEKLGTHPKIPRYEEPTERTRYITPDEEDKLLNHVRNNTKVISNSDEYADLFMLLVDTGFRFSEGNSLVWRQVNFSKQVIELWDTKGGKPRTVPMTSRVFKMLQERRKKTKGINVFNLSYWTSHTLFKHAKKAMKLQEDNEFCIHALRHTFASRLIQNGVDISTVQRLLGHSDPKTTMKYAHHNIETLRKAVQVLE